MEEPQPDYTIEELLVHGPVYAVSKVIKSVLDSPISHVAAANKLHTLFTQNQYVTDTTVDCYLNRFLLVVLNLPSSEQGKKTVFLEILDKVIFGEDSTFVSLLIQRTLITSKVPAESAADIFCYLAVKFHRQRNFYKFITLLINGVNNSKHSMVGFSLHPRLLECMAECAVKLPITQNLTLWKIICKGLGEDWTTNINSEGDFPQPRVAAQVLGVLLLNIKLADYSIRDETMDEVLTQFSNVSSKLTILMQAAIKNPKGFVSPLLTLAFAYGELHQLLLLYSPLYAERQSDKVECQVSDVKDEVWDFNFFHTYATNEQWLQLADATLKSHVSIWAPLVLQKIRYLILFSGRSRNDKEKLLKKLIDYLMEHFDLCQSLWLNNIKYVLPFMSQRQVGVVGKKMIESPQVWKSVLSDQDVTEKRTLQMSLICSVFGSIHDQSRKRKSEEDALPLSSGTLSVLRLFSMHHDFWIGSVDQSNKKVTTSLRQSAQLLQESMRQVESTTATTTERDLTELLRPLDIVECLPLEYVLGPVHSSCLMGLLSLLLSCTQEQIKSRIWLMIVRLLDAEKNSSLFEYFPCTEFMIWAVSNTKELLDCALIFSTLFDEMLRSPKSAKECFVWIKTADLSATALPVTVLAIKKLIKHKKIDEKMFSTVRKRFLKTFEPGLENRLIDALEGAHCLLEIFVEQHSKTQAKETTDNPLKIKELLNNLPKVAEAARKGLMSTDEAVGLASAEFLGLLLAHQPLLCKYVTKDIKMGTWNAYRQSPNATRWDDRLLRQLISKSSLKEFHVMTNAMIDDLQSASLQALDEETVDQVASVEVDVRRVSCFFHHLVSADLPASDDRFGIRLQVLQTALPLVQHLVLSVCRNYDSVDRVVGLAVPPMGIYLSLLNMNDSFAYPHDLTSPLHACLALPLNAHMSADHFESIFTVIYKTVHYLLTKHQEVAADRVPVLLQVYRRLMACTCSRSDSRRSAGDSEVASLTDSANRLARLASVINTQPLRYRRAAAYIIVDLLSDLKKQPLYPTVKQELTTALYHLMDLLDQHANRYLMAVLPYGIHELFRLEYEHYEKFYKFKGKV